MSKPSFSNIDLWLFELAEGNLTPEQIEQLELFILEHPELDIEKDAWELSKVDARPVVYPDIEKVQRKRRVGGVYIFSSLLVFVLMLFGVYSYLNYTELNQPGNLQAEKSNLLQREKALVEQIRELNEAYSTQGKAIAYGKLESDAEKINALRVKSINNAGQSGNQLVASNTSIASNYRINNRATSGQAIDNTESVKVNNSILKSSENNIVHSSIKPRPAREVDLGLDHSFVRNTSSSVRSTYSGGSNYSSSMKSRLKKFGRSIQRMMDNPIALKNSRDPNYHIPGMTSNDINFSSAGTLLATRFQTLSRVQWLGEENQQLMNQISIDGYAYEVRGGWSLQLNHAYYNDGGLQQSQAAFTYSPKFSVSNSISVEPSVRFKMGNKQLDADKLVGAESIEMERGNNILYSENGATPLGKNLWYKDLGAGVLVNTQWFFAGVQVDNLFRYKDNIYTKDLQDPRRAPNTFIASVGTDWLNQRKTMGLSPYAVYQHNDQLSELWVGANFKWNWLQFGLAATNNLEPAGSIGVKFEHFSMSYHADYTTSAMTNKQSLSHQLTLRIVGNQNRFNR